MFDRFTGPARNAMGLSRQAAIRLGQEYIDGVHILLGLLQVSGLHHEVLKRAGRSAAEVAGAVERRAGTGPCTGELGQLPFTPSGKAVLERTVAQAADLDEREIRPEHLLLGILSQPDEIGGAVLRVQGITLADALCVVRGETACAATASDEEPADDVPGLAAQVFDVILLVREVRREQAAQARQFEALQRAMRRVFLAGIAVAGAVASLAGAMFLR